MANPILQMMNRRNRPVNQVNNILSMINSIKGNNPDQMFSQMLQTNPKFADFVKSNQGKTIEQIAADYNIDLNAIKQFIN